MVRLLSLVYLEPLAPTYGATGNTSLAAIVIRQDALGVGLEWCEVPIDAASVSGRLAVLMGGSIDLEECIG
jgi:hypothetical protein